MWNSIEYAPIDRRKDATLPDPKHLKQWREEAALWIVNQMRQKYDISEFAEHGDMDFRTFETAVAEALSEATYDVMKKLED